MSNMTSSLAYITADIPGIGGVIKERPEDFFVEEQALYPPSGDGEHLMIMVEKSNRTTVDTIRRLARVFKVKRGAIGHAGLKDKRAVTRQHLTVHLPDPANDDKLLARMSHTPIKLLWAQRHRNKLKRGHLAGNRFVIKVRQVDASDVVRAKRALDQLTRTGLANFIGDQRFGYRQNNHLLGRALLLGDYQGFLDHLLGKPRPTDPLPTRSGREAYERGEYAAALETWPRQLRHDRQGLDALRQGMSARDAVREVDRQQREFVINSFQSAVFNDVLDRRVRDGLLGTLLPGDLAWKHDSRSVFAVDEATAAVENAAEGRVVLGEVSPSGPVWGAEMAQPSGEPQRWEREALAKHGVSESDLSQGEYTVQGRRRPMRIFLREPSIGAGVDEHGPFIRLAFGLPRGSFATMVTREIMKPEADDGGAAMADAAAGSDGLP